MALELLFMVFLRVFHRDDMNRNRFFEPVSQKCEYGEDTTHAHELILNRYYIIIIIIESSFNPVWKSPLPEDFHVFTFFGCSFTLLTPTNRVFLRHVTESFSWTFGGQKDHFFQKRQRCWSWCRHSCFNSKNAWRFEEYSHVIVLFLFCRCLQFTVHCRYVKTVGTDLGITCAW